MTLFGVSARAGLFVGRRVPHISPTKAALVRIAGFAQTFPEAGDLEIRHCEARQRRGNPSRGARSRCPPCGSPDILDRRAAKGGSR